MKKIPFLENYYITEEGKIYSDYTGRIKELKISVDTSKYKRVGLRSPEGKQKKYLVHRLVAITYIENPENLPEVNHIDGDKLNNHVSNLEWVSRHENLKHAFSIGLNSNFGDRNPRSLLTEVAVLEIYKKLLEGYRVIDLSREYGVSKGTIGSIKDRTNWNFLLKDLDPIPTKSKSKNLSTSTVKWVCSKYQDGLMPNQVLKLSTGNINIDQLYDIKRRKCYTSISKNYKW